MNKPEVIELLNDTIEYLTATGAVGQQLRARLIIYRDEVQAPSPGQAEP